MLDLLQSPVWQFVGAILTLLAILLTLALYLKQRRRKALSYAVVSSSDLLSVEEEIRGRVKVLFDNAPVENVRLVIIKLWNSGEIPISKNDYESPIRIDLGQTNTVLSYEIIHKVPENLPVELSHRREGILLNQILLNSGDSITVKILVSGGLELSVGGRIQGVKEIAGTEIKERTPYSKFDFVTYLLSLIMIFSVFISAMNIPPVKAILDGDFWGGSLIFAMICFLPFVLAKLVLRVFSRFFQ